MKVLERKELKNLMGGSTQPVFIITPSPIDPHLTGPGQMCAGGGGNNGQSYAGCYNYTSDSYQNGTSGPLNYQGCVAAPSVPC
jgi:hypothetical protein